VVAVAVAVAALALAVEKGDSYITALARARSLGADHELRCQTSRALWAFGLARGADVCFRVRPSY
jgi:hypothetical protein